MYFSVVEHANFIFFLQLSLFLEEIIVGMRELLFLKICDQLKSPQCCC